MPIGISLAAHIYSFLAAESVREKLNAQPHQIEGVVGGGFEKHLRFKSSENIEVIIFVVLCDHKPAGS